MSLENRRPVWGVIRRPEGANLSDALPLWRLRLLNRWTPRYLLLLGGQGYDQFSLFLNELSRRLAVLDLHIVDANLWFDGGKGQPTTYHNDLWFTVPLHNRVLQLWIPIVCEGSPDEIANSMVRLDPEPLPDHWAFPPRGDQIAQVWSGETRERPNAALSLAGDVPGALAGSDLRRGDTLFFDNAYCHYTLPSKAYRVGFAIRLCQGTPVYNGFFDQPRPLDNMTGSEGNRRFTSAALKGLKPGESFSPERLLRRHRSAGRKFSALLALKRFLLLFDGRSQLDPAWLPYLDALERRLGELH